MLQKYPHDGTQLYTFKGFCFVPSKVLSKHCFWQVSIVKSAPMNSPSHKVNISGIKHEYTHILFRFLALKQMWLRRKACEPY